MIDKTNWQASRLEQRSAWGISLCAILLIFVASAQPQWFDFSSPAKPIQPAHNTRSHPITPHKTSIQPPTKLTHSVSKTQHATTKTPSPSPTHKNIKKLTPQHPIKSKPIAIVSGFYVQLGAFDQRPRAQRLVDRLKKKGWSVKLAHKKDGLYGVWIGPKSNRKKVENLQHTIQRTLNYKGFIIHHTP